MVGVALLTAFVFLCVAGYDWLSLHFGSVGAGLIMAGIFAAIAVIAAVCQRAGPAAGQGTRHSGARGRAHSPSWLLDPKVLNVAVQAGRSFGWQRIVPVALLGVMVAQWAREYRDQGKQHF